MSKFSRRPDDRPGEILDAALKAFVHRGFSATRMEEIASGAGVTAGTIYRYFPSKEALVESLVDRHAEAEWSRGREIAAAYGSRTAREILLLLLGRWADHLTHGPAAALLTLMVREAPLFPTQAKKYASLLITPASRAVERALRHGIERGELAMLEIEGTSRALVSTVMGSVAWRDSFGAALDPLPPGVDPVRLAIASAVRGLPSAGEEALVVPARLPTLEEELVTRPAMAQGLRIVTLRPPEGR
jgi:AcrR family transcriptional regulator